MKKKVTILAARNSWIVPYAKRIPGLCPEDCSVSIIYDHKRIRKGDHLFILSYEKIIPEELLNRNRYNLVVHESFLPKGKGWSPLTWQVLEGKKNIPITLFEATKDVDSGPIYFQEKMRFRGDELIDEMRKIQGEMTIKLVLKFLRSKQSVTPKKQKGRESFYKKRGPGDSVLDINSTIKEQFNLLRVVDNERYPAFFILKGKKYLLKITKAERK